MIRMYNSYYPPYQPSYMQQNGAMPDMLNQIKIPYQQGPNNPPQAPKPTNDIIWVQGEAGAKGYLVAPNNTVVLWDTENPIIYIKTADATGLPTMRILDFKEREGTIPQNSSETSRCKCGDKFATIEQLNSLEAKILAIQEQYATSKDSEAEKTKNVAKKSKESEE